MAKPPTSGYWFPFLDVQHAAHFTALPDYGAWKFYSDFRGLQFRYYNDAQDWFIFSESYWLPEDIIRAHGIRWRLAHDDMRDSRRFKSVTGAIRAIEKMEE